MMRAEIKRHRFTAEEYHRIVDLQGRKVEIHTNPGPGGYLSVREVDSGGQIRAATIEDLSLSLDEILP